MDDLFKFLTHWVPDRYGPLGDVSAQGYELIDSDTEWDDDEAKPGHKVRFILYIIPLNVIKCFSRLAKYISRFVCPKTPLNLYTFNNVAVSNTDLSRLLSSLIKIRIFRAYL